MRKILIIILILAIIIAIALSGYIIWNNSNKEKNKVQNDQPVKHELHDVIEYGYLKMGEWGIASKYSSKKEEYEDVNVTIKQMIRGQEAEKIVKEYTENNKYFTYSKPQEGMEWLVVEYQINLGDFSKGANGANSDIQTTIKGFGDEKNIIIGNKEYEIKTQDISDREYTNEKQVTGRFVSQIPVECEEYVVMFGNEEYSYCEFRGVTNKTEDKTTENEQQNLSNNKGEE